MALGDFSLTNYRSKLPLRWWCAFVRVTIGAAMPTKTAIISIGELKSENIPVLREALLAVPGVGEVDFSVERSVAVLEFDPSQSHIDDFLRAVLKAGFKVL
jgi:hypothetical protein